MVNDTNRQRVSSTVFASDAPTARARIARDVVKGLYEGRYAPGERLLEAELTSRYGVSRGPVREALNQLEAMGVVRLIPHHGAEVRRLTIDEAIDILVVVQGLVGVGARLAAQNITKPGADERIKAAFEALALHEPGDHSAAYGAARDAFYGAITMIAANAELSRILPSVQVHLIRVQFRSAMRWIDRRRRQAYRNIADAILSGDAKAAEKAARAHFERQIAALKEFRDASLGT